MDYEKDIRWLKSDRVRKLIYASRMRIRYLESEVERVGGVLYPVINDENNSEGEGNGRHYTTAQ